MELIITVIALGVHGDSIHAVIINSQLLVYPTALKGICWFNCLAYCFVVTHNRQRK